MKIEIKDLNFKCIIGILDFERIEKQKVIIDISFEYEFDKDIFIDYSEVSSFIKKQMKKKKFLLIEDALIYFENELYNKYKINKLYLKISKPDILKDCVVSVSN